jgi:tRNA 2-selenouridine synthase
MRGAIERITRGSFDYLRENPEFNSIPMVDLRSEGEFADGHIPNAVSVPLFNNDQRAQVGTCYKQEGKKPAVQLGLELLAGQIDPFNEALWRQSRDGKIVVHCWRGGMRSWSVAIFLASQGLEVFVLDGGYKAYRAWVRNKINEFSQHKLLIITGRTGSGKSEFVSSLPKAFPVIDLEAIACHRGSAFGHFKQANASPTQQQFENLLIDEYMKIAHHRAIVLEIEHAIGPVKVPTVLRHMMMKSEMVLIERSLKDRVELLKRTYTENWTAADDDDFSKSLQQLARYISKVQLGDLQRLLAERNFDELIKQLLVLRYDPIYDRGLQKHEARIIKTFVAPSQQSELLSFVSQYAISQ